MALRPTGLLGDRRGLGSEASAPSELPPMAGRLTPDGVLPPAPARATLCVSTGDTSRAFGLNTGVAEPGREADFVIPDAPRGSAAKGGLGALAVRDMPSVVAVIIDGEVRVFGSRNTPPQRTISLPLVAAGGHETVGPPAEALDLVPYRCPRRSPKPVEFAVQPKRASPMCPAAD